MMKNLMRSKFLWIVVLLSVGLVACAPRAEPPAATDVAVATPVTENTAVPSPIPSTAEPTIEAAPTEETPAAESSPTPAIPPTEVPLPTAEAGGQLPVVEELSFTIGEQLGGVPHALAVDGTIVYVGFGPRLLVLDVSDSTNPQLLGKSEPLRDIVRGVEVAGGLAYVADGRGGLVVLDAADPANLTIISAGPNYSEADQPSAEDITVVDTIAYVTDFNRMDGSVDLLRFDVTNPAQVTILDALDLEPNESVAVEGGVIVVVGNGRMQLRDAAAPTTVLSETTLASGAYASRAIIHENIVTVAESGETTGLEQFDISNPAAPVALGALIPADFFFINGSVTNGQTLFLDATFGEFGHCSTEIYAIDLSADAPTPANKFDPANCVTDLELAGDTLYVIGRSGLQLYNISDPANPLLSGQFRNPAGFHGAESIIVRDDIGYVLAAEGRSFDIATVNLNQPDDPASERVTVGTETLIDLFLTGNTLIAQVWMGGLNTLDISNPAMPQILHQAVQGELYTGDFSALAVGEDVVYTAVISDTLVGAIGAIDLSDPANPTIAGVVETGVPQVMSLALGGEILYALTQGEVNQIHFIDVSQPLQPEPLITLNLPEFVSRLELVGDTLFAICDGFNCQNIYSIDVSDPRGSIPVIAGQWALPVGAIEAETDGQGLLYLVTQSDGIWVLNAADPANPYIAGRFQLANDFARLEIVEDTIYAAAFDAGLYIIQPNQ